jgi:hypothetical protein
MRRDTVRGSSKIPALLRLLSFTDSFFQSRKNQREDDESMTGPAWMAPRLLTRDFAKEAHAKT